MTGLGFRDTGAPTGSEGRLSRRSICRHARASESAWRRVTVSSAMKTQRIETESAMARNPILVMPKSRTLVSL